MRLICWDNFFFPKGAYS